MAANNRTTYDVLIAGAGPAGAAAAKKLVDIGYRVAIAEKRQLPRYKICSGLVIDRAQDLLNEYFGDPPEEVFCAPALLKGVRICPKGDIISDFPLGKPYIYNVWRSSFDRWLVQQSGADVLEEHKLIGFRQAESAVYADIEDPDKELLHIKASYLIGADGGSSLARNRLDSTFNKQVHWNTFVQLYCTGDIELDPEFYYMFFDPSLQAFYTWLHYKDDYLVYGVGTRIGESLSSCVDESTKYLEKYFDLKVDSVNRKTGCIVSDMAVSGNFMPGGGRVLLAGEAAGFMNVFGEGISSALATGHLAASAICEADASGDPVLPIYEELLEPEKRMTVQSWGIAGDLSIAKKQ
ncbi:MAG: hypothetical protein AVO39_09330 [delta proteobacterium MLS_D]|jgi:menaquinone-9 beta-reductase|nr:MAG: hypothetical protein AVO39_09330 [delta proteobacterium MLS_D]